MNPDERVGVVLAAGLGSRLARPGQRSSVKPLIDIRGVPLLFRTLRSLEIAGCGRAVIVLGHAATLVHRAIDTRYQGPLHLQFAYNPYYALQNGLSALCARPWVEGTEFVVTMADHLLDDAIMERVRDITPPANGAVLMVDYDVEGIFDIDDATKVVAEGETLVDIGKTLPTYNCIDTGVFVCTTGLMDALDHVYYARGDASLSEGVARLAARGTMKVADIGDAFWQDVDTPEMLAHAEHTLNERNSGNAVA